MKFSLSMKAFFEAAGITTYVIIFAIAVQSAQTWFAMHQVFPSPVLTLILFLLAFIISALICSFLVLLYPIKLFIAGHKDAAWKVLFWSGGWLIIFLGVFGGLALATL